MNGWLARPLGDNTNQATAFGGGVLTIFQIPYPMSCNTFPVFISTSFCWNFVPRAMTSKKSVNLL